MQVLHNLTPQKDWVIWDYKDNVPESAHRIIQYNGEYGLACTTVFYQTREELDIHYIPMRKQDIKCGECLRKIQT